MVIQKEPRSRRVEDDSDEGSIGASGLRTPVTSHQDIGEGRVNGAANHHEGVNVPQQDVTMANAEMEDLTAEQAFEDEDHIDDDDDEDIAIARAETENQDTEVQDELQ